MSLTEAPRPLRAGVLVVALALAAYANSVGNGFAYDDERIIEENPIVNEARVADALRSPYWPTAVDGAGLYRPVAVASYAVEWGLFKGSTVGYHALSILVHALVSLLVFLLLLELAPTGAALAGAALFAVHPVHTEAVANVVGRAELYAAGCVLAACVLFLRGAHWTEPGRRAARLVGVAGLYALALGSKEMGVTLPGVLIPLALLSAGMGRAAGHAAGGVRARLRGLLDDTPLFVLLGAVLAAYLGTRYLVLGSVTGELPAPELAALSTGDRLLTAVSLWSEYARLMLFPLDLAVDYAPGVFYPAHGLDLEVIGGALTLASLGVAVAVTLRRRPTIALGILWFAVTILPVSNMLVPTGTLLAERTLYLPSVGLALVVAGAAGALAERPGHVRAAAVWALVLVGSGFFVRTVTRNPSWFSTFTVLETLAHDHPDSHLALRARANGLVRAGEPEAAADVYEGALELAPYNYPLLVEVAAFYGRQERWERAESLLVTAVRAYPTQATAWQLLTRHLILQGRAREGHSVALRGLELAGPDRELWSLVSESYIVKGDLEASIRARRAALAVDPGSGHDWGRLAELLEATGRTDAAVAARSRARALGDTLPGVSSVHPVGASPDRGGGGA